MNFTRDVAPRILWMADLIAAREGSAAGRAFREEYGTTRVLALDGLDLDLRWRLIQSSPARISGHLEALAALRAEGKIA